MTEDGEPPEESVMRLRETADLGCSRCVATSRRIAVGHEPITGRLASKEQGALGSPPAAKSYRE